MWGLLRDGWVGEKDILDWLTPGLVLEIFHYFDTAFPV